MTQSKALIPNLLDRYADSFLGEVIATVAGVALISLLAQVYLFLPWTPVPITGQTFGVALVALSFGSRRAFIIVLAYLGVGAVGFPVFAMGKAGLAIGPTLGYLIGMLAASFVVGTLADRGWTKSFWRSLAAAYCGSAVIFMCGLFVLSFYIPSEALLAAGLWPFLLGDLIKNTLAAAIAWSTRNADGSSAA